MPGQEEGVVRHRVLIAGGRRWSRRARVVGSGGCRAGVAGRRRVASVLVAAVGSAIILLAPPRLLRPAESSGDLNSGPDGLSVSSDRDGRGLATFAAVADNLRVERSRGRPRPQPEGPSGRRVMRSGGSRSGTRGRDHMRSRHSLSLPVDGIRTR